MPSITLVLEEWTQKLKDLRKNHAYPLSQRDVSSRVLKDLRDKEEGFNKLHFYSLAPREGDHVAVSMAHLEVQIDERVRRIDELRAKRDTIGRDIHALLTALQITSA